MSAAETPAALLGAFFQAFGSGNAPGLIALFARDATVTAVREGSRNGGVLHGSYRGTAGVEEFVTAMGATFDTQAFTVDEIVGSETTAFASGSFTHLVRATGRSFSSLWAARIVADGGKIASFTFYEDSAAFHAAAA
jgi:uncharacterized protein